MSTVITNQENKPAIQAYRDLNQWQAEQRSGKEVAISVALDALGRLYTSANISSLTFALPYLLRLHGQPFSLIDHFPLEPLYSRVDVPRSLLLKCGRQVAKCVDVEELVWLSNGQPIMAGKIKVGDTVCSVLPDRAVGKGKVTSVFENGTKPIYSVKTEHGLSVRTTKEHRLLTPEGYQAVGDMHIGSVIMRTRRAAAFGTGHASLSIIRREIELCVRKQVACTLSHWVWDLDPKHTAIFIRELWQTAGYVIEWANGVGYTHAIKLHHAHLEAEIRALLTKFGLDVRGHNSGNYRSVIIPPKYHRYFNELLVAPELAKAPSAGPNDLQWDRVISIELDGEFDVIDLEIETEHNYVLNGIVSHNSTTLAALGTIRAATTPYFNQLFVTPLCEQIQRFSNNYIAPFIRNSPLRDHMLNAGLADTDGKGRMNVFQRTFANEANMFFSFAFLDVDRVRGVAADQLAIDEVQDMDPEFIPILRECLSASKKGRLKLYSGTPKTSNSAIALLWQDSSQAHWAIKCTHCNHINICALEYGLDKMVTRAGFRCGKCSGTINSRTGMWWHAYPDRRNEFPGYHVPQPILPMHYADSNDWHDLYQKKLKYSQSKYLNEVLGEDCDVGSKLVTRQQLAKCCKLPWNSNLKDALKAVKEHDFKFITMGVDWGAGAAGRIRRVRGKISVEEGSPSFTHVAITGFNTYSTNPMLIYAERLPAGMLPDEESQRIIQLFNSFTCRLIGHDYGGAGSLRETMLIQAGMNANAIIPFTYTAQPRKPIVVYNKPGALSPRRSYSLDKTRSLAVLCASINGNMVQFPRDWVHAEDYLGEFLNLMEERIDRPSGSDLYRISAHPGKPCDFPHALNYACFAQWYHEQTYPDLAKHFGVTMDVYDEPDALPNTDWD